MRSNLTKLAVSAIAVGTVAGIASSYPFMENPLELGNYISLSGGCNGTQGDVPAHTDATFQCTARGTNADTSDVAGIDSVANVHQCAITGGLNGRSNVGENSLIVDSISTADGRAKYSAQCYPDSGCSNVLTSMPYGCGHADGNSGTIIP